MQDFTVHRCSRRCQKSDRPLEPGERFYSVVSRKGANFKGLITPNGSGMVRPRGRSVGGGEDAFARIEDTKAHS